MNYTPNLNLNKPEKAEQYNIDHWNDNSDIIDNYANTETSARLAGDASLQSQVNENRNVTRLIGTVGISQGGTGKTTAQEAINNLHSGVQTQSSIDANDEVTFIKRTHADVSLGIEESIDVKGVTLNTLASKVFDLLKANNNNLFSSSQNGLTPKTNSASLTNFLRSDGVWAVPPRTGDDFIDVQASNSYSLTSNTIFKITATSAVTIVLTDPSQIGLKATFINNSDTLTHSLSTTNVEGSTVDSVLPNSYFEITWNGSAWVNLTAPGVGSQVAQYPNQKSPEEVYPCSKWEVLNYGGAFFRASGGNASAFNSGLQGDQNKWHNHGGLTSEVYTNHTHNFYWQGDHSHGYSETYGDTTSGYGGSGTGRWVNQRWTGTGAATIVVSGTTGSSNGEDESIKHKHTISGDGGNEARPQNYTYKIWKRVA